MATGIKDEARRLLEALPEDSDWDDLVDAILDRLKIEQGLADADAGRVVSNEEVRRRFGLPA